MIPLQGCLQPARNHKDKTLGISIFNLMQITQRLKLQMLAAVYRKCLMLMVTLGRLSNKPA